MKSIQDTTEKPEYFGQSTYTPV